MEFVKCEKPGGWPTLVPLDKVAAVLRVCDVKGADIIDTVSGERYLCNSGGTEKNYIENCITTLGK